MTARSRDIIERVKENVDIVNVISDYVKLKKSGKNYKGLCPFHQEKTPSFTVNPNNQFYHCFGCGAGGDVYNFLMEIEHITFKESLKLLARRAGIELPKQTKAQKKRARTRERLFEINQLAARFYNYLLLEHEVGNKAGQYLKKRGFSKKDINNFYLGFAPNRWDSLLNFLLNKGYSKEILVKSGLIIKKEKNKYYDRFRNRIIFPIFNMRDEVLAFGGRIIDDSIPQPKYLNSPDTLIYDKGKNLYGLNWARSNLRENKDIIIMEGYTDVLTAYKEGINNAVASLGTSLTTNQARLLNRYIDKTYIAYDADTAGARATLRGMEILKKEGLSVRVIDLPEDMDPDDYIQNKGKESFLKLKNEALTLVEFKVNKILRNEEINNPEDKVKISHKIIEILAELKDPLEREAYSYEIAKKIGVKKDLLFREVEKHYKKKNKKDKNSENRYTKNVNKTNSSQRINIKRLEKNVLKAYIDFPELRELIEEKITPEHFQNKKSKKICEILFNLDNIKMDSHLDSINDETIKNNIMQLIVAESDERAPSCISGWLNKLIDNYLFNKKILIYNKLQQKNITNNTLNRLLIEYQKLIDSRKEGV